MFSNDTQYPPPGSSKVPSNIRVRAATASDADGLSDCFYVSFWPSHKFWTLTFPPELFHTFWVDAFRMGIEDDHSMRTYVATDEDKGGKIVGFMRWQVPQGDGKLEEMWPDLPQKSDMDVLGPFFGGMEKNRHDLMGKRPHWFLQLLATTTEYQGQGIGECFVKWGCDLADKDDLEVYIDASEKGAPFYQKHFGAVPKADIPLPERPDGYGEFTYVSHVVPKKSERGNTR